MIGRDEKGKGGSVTSPVGVAAVGSEAAEGGGRGAGRQTDLCDSTRGRGRYEIKKRETRRRNPKQRQSGFVTNGKIFTPPPPALRCAAMESEGREGIQSEEGEERKVLFFFFFSVCDGDGWVGEWRTTSPTGPTFFENE